MHPRIQQLAEFKLDSVVRKDDKYFSFEPVETKLAGVINSARELTNRPDYWSELPEQDKAQIVAEVEALLSNLQTIVDHLEDPTWLTPNYEGQVQVVIAHCDALYRLLVVGIRNYLSALEPTKKETAAVLSSLKQASKESKQVSRVAAEAASDIGTMKLSEFFSEMAVGRVQDIPSRVQLRSRHKYLWLASFFSSRLKHTFRRMFLFEFGGYQGAARIWFFITLVSVGATYWAARSFFHGDLSKITLYELLAKAIVVGAFAYLIRFCVRNYNANKHLATVNRHRAVTMHTLLAFLSREEVTAVAKESVVIEASKHVFNPGETGYLTRRDSVGGSDPVFEMPFTVK